MEFSYTDAQESLKSGAREFYEDNEKQLATYHDEQRFPMQLFRNHPEYGPTIIIPEKYGGDGMGAIEYSIVSEELGFYQTTFQVARSIISTGSESQKKRYLPDLAACEYPGAITISEPNTGSSLKQMETTGEEDGDSFVLNGSKTHSNLGAEAGLHTVYASTEEGLTVFLVEDDNPGLVIDEKLDPIGMRTMPIYSLELDDCRVPKDQVLGDVGGGYEVFFNTFNFSRIGNASSLIGMGRRALDAALEYASQREVGNKGMVTDFQGNRWTIADLHTKLEAATRLRDEAAWRINEGKSAVLQTSRAKLMAADAALPATLNAIQMTGAHGLYNDQPFMRYFSDAKTLEVAGGSREVMRNVISDEVLAEYEE